MKTWVFDFDDDDDVQEATLEAVTLPNVQEVKTVTNEAVTLPNVQEVKTVTNETENDISQEEAEKVFYYLIQYENEKGETVSITQNTNYETAKFLYGKNVIVRKLGTRTNGYANVLTKEDIIRSKQTANVPPETMQTANVLPLPVRNNGISQEAQRILDNLASEKASGFSNIETWGKLVEYPSESELLEKANELEQEAKTNEANKHVLLAVATTIRKNLNTKPYANAEKRRMLFTTANTTLNNVRNTKP